MSSSSSSLFLPGHASFGCSHVLLVTGSHHVGVQHLQLVNFFSAPYYYDGVWIMDLTFSPYI